MSGSADAAAGADADEKVDPSVVWTAMQDTAIAITTDTEIVALRDKLAAVTSLKDTWNEIAPKLLLFFKFLSGCRRVRDLRGA